MVAHAAFRKRLADSEQMCNSSAMEHIAKVCERFERPHLLYYSSTVTQKCVMKEHGPATVLQIIMDSGHYVI